MTLRDRIPAPEAQAGALRAERAPFADLLSAAEELIARLDNGDPLDTSALREAVDRIREVTP
jgi:hypothetical protein